MVYRNQILENYCQRTSVLVLFGRYPIHIYPPRDMEDYPRVLQLFGASAQFRMGLDSRKYFNYCIILFDLVGTLAARTFHPLISVSHVEINHICHTCTAVTGEG
jgi:hypothetical protein